jgi:hypothetical protein
LYLPCNKIYLKTSRFSQDSKNQVNLFFLHCLCSVCLPPNYTDSLNFATLFNGVNLFKQDFIVKIGFCNSHKNSVFRENMKTKASKFWTKNEIVILKMSEKYFEYKIRKLGDINTIAHKQCYVTVFQPPENGDHFTTT